MKTPAPLLDRLLGSAQIQRALLADRPGYLYGPVLRDANQAGLVSCSIWKSRRGVHRHFNTAAQPGPKWAVARLALLDARRGRNMTIDPLLVGPAMKPIKSRYGLGMAGWRASWEGRDGPKLLREVGSQVYDTVTKVMAA